MSTNGVSALDADGNAVFTNISGGDLLQQALQPIIGDEDGEQNYFQPLQGGNNFMILQNMGSCNNVIQVTPLTMEQLIALGINVDKVENSVSVEQGIDETDNYQENRLDEPQPEQQQSIEIEFSEADTDRMLEELAQNLMPEKKDEVLENVTFEDWTVQSQDQQQQQSTSETCKQNSLQSNVVVQSITMENNSNHQTNQIEEQTSNFLHIQANQSKELGQKQNMPKSISLQCNQSVSPNTIQFSTASSNSQINNITQTHSQTLQRFPVFLSASQFLPKTKSLSPFVKNTRMLSNATKVNFTQTSQNFFILPKNTLTNTTSSQVAVPIGTQLINASHDLSAQSISTSQFLSIRNSQNCTNNSNSNQIIEDSFVTTSVNNIPAVMQNLVRQASVQRPAQGQIQQKANVVKFFTPIIKSKSNIIKIDKKAPTTNNHIIHKSKSIPILKKFNPSMITTKNPVTVSLQSLSKINNSHKTFKTKSVIKTDPNLKPSTSSFNTSNTKAQMSVLKPQVKAVNSYLVNQNFTNPVTHKNLSSKLSEVDYGSKPIHIKQGVKFITKTFKDTPITPRLKIQGAMDCVKGLEANGKPVQFIHQGVTYSNGFSQAQFKPIYETANNPTDTISYRLVYSDESIPKMKNVPPVMKNRNSKRGRPKKGAVRTPVIPSKPAGEEEHDDSKDDRKKLVARTRSGRLSRPPRHMVRDYKHLHHVDSTQQEHYDSDGGYSDYNACGTGSGRKLVHVCEEAGQKTELLTGLEIPKRKISDDFKCPTCGKIYLGRNRMSKHFTDNPDHGSQEQLPPLTAEAEMKQSTPLDPLKRKGKKRGPWAYTTPEAKSERRQVKLREAITVCNSSEIAKVAAKPVLETQSLYDLLLLKSDNNVHTFMSEVKEFVERVYEKTSTMLSTVTSTDDLEEEKLINLNDKLLCKTLNLSSGSYKVVEPLTATEEAEIEAKSESSFELDASIETNSKEQQLDNTVDGVKENIESGYSENSDLSINEFFTELKTDSSPQSEAPEALSTINFLSRSNTTSPINNKSIQINPTANVLNTSMEVHNTNTPRFQKLSINAETKANPNFIKEGAFTKLGDSLEPSWSSSSTNDVFTNFNGNFDQSKMDNTQRTFIKLEPKEDGFIKLENGIVNDFPQEVEDFGKIQTNGFHYVSGSLTNNFNSKGLQTRFPKTNSASATSVLNQNNLESVDNSSNHEVSGNSIQIITSSNSNASIPDDTADIYESLDNNIDLSANYDHISPIDMMSGGNALDENLQFVDNGNMIIDELVSGRLNLIADNMLDGNLLQHNGNLDALDFEELSEE